MPLSEQEVPVLVVGGSLVGLTTSVLLASMASAYADRTPQGTAIHPRGFISPAHDGDLPQLGLQQAVEAAAEREFVQNGAIISVDALSGKELACFYGSFNEGVEGLSPTSRLFITQIGLEPLLRERARELGADHHYATEMVSFEQDHAGVSSCYARATVARSEGCTPATWSRPTEPTASCAGSSASAWPGAAASPTA